jgi:rare lipoprotein A (peptidoglycan hydrolase)
MLGKYKSQCRLDRKRGRGGVYVLFLVMLLTAVRATATFDCGDWRQVPLPQWTVPLPSEEVGVASWYGHPYHGRKAANGAIYNMHKLTAAHRTLPFGTLVRVHNLANARTVEVVITDRGPFIDGRIIDLSLAAARILRFQRAGLAAVRLELLSAPAAELAMR